MKCEIIIARKIDFRNGPSLNGTTSCLYVQLVPFSGSSSNEDELISESEDEITISSDHLNNRLITVMHKVLMFDSTEAETATVKKFLKLFSINGDETDANWGKKLTPKHVCLNADRLPFDVGCEFYQRYSSDTADHAAGDYVMNSNGEKQVFDHINITVLCDANNVPKEDVNILGKRNWDSNVATSIETMDSLYIPVVLYNRLLAESTEKARQKQIAEAEKAALSAGKSRTAKAVVSDLF